MDIRVDYKITTVKGLRRALEIDVLDDIRQITISVAELKELLGMKAKPYELIPEDIPKPERKKRTRRKPLRADQIRVCALPGCNNVLTQQQMQWNGRYCSRSCSAKSKYLKEKATQDNGGQTRKPVVVEAGIGVRDDAPLA